MQWSGILQTLWADLKQSFFSVLRDGTVWVLLGPFIFRVNLSHATHLWESATSGLSSVSSQGHDDSAGEFRRYWFLAYYSVHLLTLIVAWVLFLVRYFPEALKLFFIMSGYPTTISVMGILYAVVWILSLIAGMWGFWLQPQFVSSELIVAYIRHNEPANGGPASRQLFGPLRPPPCNLTAWRLRLLVLSLIAATFAPFA